MQQEYRTKSSEIIVALTRGKFRSWPVTSCQAESRCLAGCQVAAVFDNVLSNYKQMRKERKRSRCCTDRARPERRDGVVCRVSNLSGMSGGAFCGTPRGCYRPAGTRSLEGQVTGRCAVRASEDQTCTVARADGKNVDTRGQKGTQVKGQEKDQQA